MRIMTDQEDAYIANLQKINDIVENVKKDRREKKDEKKRDRQAAKDAMLHTAAKFQALRNSEKRLMAKIAEEEKTKKRGEERQLRQRLLNQQKDAKQRERDEIAAKALEVEKLRTDEIKAAGLDRLDMSVQGLRFIRRRCTTTLPRKQNFPTWYISTFHTTSWTTCRKAISSTI